MTQLSASGRLRNKREVAQTGTDVAQNTVLVHRGARSPKHAAWCPIHSLWTSLSWFSESGWGGVKVFCYLDHIFPSLVPIQPSAASEL